MPDEASQSSASDSDPSAPSDSPQSDAEGRFRCDFCGDPVPRVRRVALDRDYDRLQKPHQVQYACPECSELKDRERAGA